MAEFKNQNVHVLNQDGTQSSLLQSMLFEQLVTERLQQDRLDQAKGMVETCTGIVAAFKQSESEARSNGELSARGVETAITTAQEKATKKLASVESLIASLAADGARIEDTMLRGLMTAPTDVVAEMKKQQARIDFSNIDDLMRPVSYLAACQDGRADLECSAVEESNIFNRLLDAVTISKGRAIRAERTNPDKSADLRELKTVIDVASRSVAQAKRDLALPFGIELGYRQASGAVPDEVEAIGDNVTGPA